MSSNDWMQAALQHYREQRERIIEQLPSELLYEFRAAELMIRKLEQDLGAGSQMVITDPPYATSSALVFGQPAIKPSAKTEVRADEFFAMTISEAARQYLNRVGHAVSLEELLEKLRAGGCRVGGANPKQTLYISLVRNTRDFVPTGGGHIGLRSFYPGLKAGATKADKPKKGKEKNKSKPKRTTGKASTATKKLLEKKKETAKATKPATEETPAHTVVYGILKDGALHQKQAILKAGADAGVPPIAIHGLFRHAKDIEVVGEDVRLKKESDSPEHVKIESA